MSAVLFWFLIFFLWLLVDWLLRVLLYLFVWSKWNSQETSFLSAEGFFLCFYGPISHHWSVWLLFGAFCKHCSRLPMTPCTPCHFTDGFQTPVSSQGHPPLISFLTMPDAFIFLRIPINNRRAKWKSQIPQEWIKSTFLALNSSNECSAWPPEGRGIFQFVPVFSLSSWV